MGFIFLMRKGRRLNLCLRQANYQRIGRRPHFRSHKHQSGHYSCKG